MVTVYVIAGLIILITIFMSGRRRGRRNRYVCKNCGYVWERHHGYEVRCPKCHSTDAYLK